MTYHLQERNADVEGFIHVCVPHQPHVRHPERSQVSLKINKTPLNYIVKINLFALSFVISRISNK